jgi:hypothetical protein
MPLKKNTSKLVAAALDEQLIQAIERTWFLGCEEPNIPSSPPMDQPVSNVTQEGSLLSNSPV